MNTGTELSQQIAELQAKQEAAGNRVGNVLSIALTLATGHHAADAHATTDGMTVAYWRGFVVTAEAIYDNISDYVDAHVLPKARAEIKAIDEQLQALVEERDAAIKRAKLIGAQPKKIVHLN